MADSIWAMRSKIQTKNYTLDWKADRPFLTTTLAAMRAIDETNRRAVQIAKMHPFWDNDSGQTEDAVFQREAEVEIVGTTARSTPHVWGQWGVEDRPHLRKDQERWFSPSPKYEAQFEEAYHGEIAPEGKVLSTVDVALFLEFGTVKMTPRPWLYPAWDATKHLLPLYVAREQANVAKTVTPFAPVTTPGMRGRPFMSFKKLADYIAAHSRGL